MEDCVEEHARRQMRHSMHMVFACRLSPTNCVQALLSGEGSGGGDKDGGGGKCDVGSGGRDGCHPAFFYRGFYATLTELRGQGRTARISCLCLTGPGKSCGHRNVSVRVCMPACASSCAHACRMSVLSS